MKEENKGLHSLDYNFEYLRPSHHLYFEERVCHAIKKECQSERRGSKVVTHNWLSFEGAPEDGRIALDGLGDVASSFGVR